MSEPTKEDLILKSNYQKKIKEKQKPTKQEREANNKYNRWYRQSSRLRHEEALDWSKEWKLKNPEKTKVSKDKWAKNNKEKTRAAFRKWLKRNPDYMQMYHQRRKLEKVTVEQAEV